MVAAGAVFVLPRVFPGSTTPRPNHVGTTATEPGDPVAAEREAVEAARRGGVPGLTTFIVEQRRRVEEADTDQQRAQALEILAFALSERCSARNAGRGIQVGKPLYDEVPEPTEADVVEGLAAIERARELGLETSEGHRIEGLLLSCRVINLVSAMRWNSQIQKTTARAFEIWPDNPRAHIAQAVREVLTPSFLGQDPESALERLRPAAKALPGDERPLVFAAFAAHLLDRRDEAIELLEQACERRPDVRYPPAVLKRLREGVEKPFAIDVEETPTATGH